MSDVPSEPTTPSEETVESNVPPLRETIAFDDFMKLDLRVATIVEAEAHSNADRLIKLQLDLGELGPRQICAGVKAYYEPASLVGRQIIVVANLAPRKIRGEVSNGMLLAASDVAEDSPQPVVLLNPMSAVAPGSTVG